MEIEESISCFVMFVYDAKRKDKTAVLVCYVEYVFVNSKRSCFKISQYLGREFKVDLNY